MNQNQNQSQKINKKQIQFVQAQRRALGISDELYAEMKRSVGVESTRDLTGGQLDELVRRMNGSVLRRSAHTRMTVGGDEIARMDGEKTGKRPPYKPVHSSAYRSGMHRKPAPDRENMVRKVEAILAEMRLPWSYADGMARRMCAVDAFRFCDADQTYRILQALCVYQRRRNRPAPSAEKEVAGDEPAREEAARLDTARRQYE